MCLKFWREVFVNFVEVFILFYFIRLGISLAIQFHLNTRI